jgi:prepilin-type N-terminal cleavage/methylation domain-containing protein
MRYPHRPAISRGFTLIEGVVALAILSTVILLGALWLQQRGQTEVLETMLSQQALEMSQLGRAATEHVQANPASYAPNTNGTIAITTLESAGLLPASFARRDTSRTTVAVSPFLQAYSIHRATDGEGRTRIVVTVANEALNEARLTRAGRKGGDETTLGIARAVAQKMAADHSVTSGVVPKESRTATGNFEGYSINLAVYIPITTVAKPVVLANFPEFDPGGSTVVGPPGSEWGDCRFVQAPYAGTADATCPTGYQEAASWNHCQSWPQNADTIVATPVGPLFFSMSHTYTDNRSHCGGDCSTVSLSGDPFGSPTRCGYGPSDADRGVCGLPGARVENLGMATASNRFVVRTSNYVTRTHFTETVSLGQTYLFDRLCAQNWETWQSPSVQQFHWKTPAHAQNRRDKLCCKPRT